MTAPKPNKPMAAYCFSCKCVDHGSGIKAGVHKPNIPISATYCPDCKSVLVWKRLGSMRNPGLLASRKMGVH